MAVRDYHIIKVGLSTGLGVQEIADLKCNDFPLANSNILPVDVKMGMLTK